MANEIVSTSPNRLLEMAIEHGAHAEVVERLARLQAEMLDRQGEIDFNEAMNRCQQKIAMVNPDKTGDKGKYATYAAIEKAIKPIYTDEGFSLSWGEADCPIAEHIRLICYVSRGRHTRRYQKDWPIVTKGPKGNDVMTPTHAHGSADSYAKRYLLKDIWNVSVGEEDDDGNMGMGNVAVANAVGLILKSQNEEELKRATLEAKKAALSSRDYKALKIVDEAFDKRHKEFANA